MGTAIQTFLISESIRGRRISGLPLSVELASALKRLRIHTLGDLSGVSLREFQRVSDRGKALFLEIGQHIQRARHGDFASPATQQSRRNRHSAPPSGKCPTLPAASVPYGVQTPESIDRIAATTKSPQEEEVIFIPQEARGKLLDAFPVSSVRLKHVLECNGFRLVGDLHGLAFSNFLRLRNCGKKTVNELRELVRAIQSSHHVCQVLSPEIRQSAAVQADVFFVAASAREMNPFELPISVRLECALKSKGVVRLGDLDQVSASEFLEIKNCGKRTVEELIGIIQRVGNGEFQPPSREFSIKDIGDLLGLLDDILAKLPLRDRETLLLRLGAENNRTWTLEEVGAKFSLTRERVRQIVDVRLSEMVRAGGPRLKVQLKGIAAICQNLVCPLTPALVSKWTAESSHALRFTPGFYVRLFGALDPDIPTWPIGHEPSVTRESREEAITEALERVLREGEPALTVKTVFELTRAQTAHRRLEVAEFLAALKNAKRVVVQFPQPDMPEVRLRWLRGTDVARAILAASERPLTPEEICSRAEAKFGNKLATWSPRALGNSLTSEKGFYLLGPRAYGLRQHFKLPERSWRGVREDFRQLLEKEKRPISTTEVVSGGRFPWTENANSYEAAEVLREDKRFMDLGRFLFALESWGVQAKERVKDLVPRILAKNGRPMTLTRIVEELQRLRSVSPYGISNIIRNTPEVRQYGFGYYGLKSWERSESVQVALVSDVALVERVIRRSEPPLLFGRLCEIVQLPAEGERADALWKTCASLRSVIRIPEERSRNTVVLHKSCSLERALEATARSVNRPLPLYEFQWELNERFGPLFTEKSLDDLRRCLEQSPMFLRNAAGEFILDIHLDQLGLDVNAIRRACAEILLESKEIVGCEDLLERLETNGMSWEELSPDILASVLRDDPVFQEVGRDRFRVKECKH